MEVPHAIDAMHMQNNVFKSLIATLMDTGKTKDGLKSWKDMVHLNVKAELHPVPEGNGKYTLPTASFNMTLEERRKICTFLRVIKVLTRFSSNVKRLVSMKDLSIKNFKAHDCHVMQIVFLSIAIRAIKPEFLKWPSSACVTSCQRSHRRQLVKMSFVTYMNSWWRPKTSERCVYLPLFLYNVTSHDSHGSSDRGPQPLLLA